MPIMASPPCNQCPRLRSQITHLEHQLAFLRQVLADTTAGVRATVEFIDQQDTDPTMSRRIVVPAIHNWLTYVLDVAEGKRV
jgi:hypothetical protein